MKKEKKEKKEKDIIERLIHALGIFLLAFLVLGGFFLFETINKKNYQEAIEKEEKQQEAIEKEARKEIEEEFNLEKPKEVTYKWNYNNESFNLNTTLYESLYNHYNSLSKKYTCKGTCPKGWEEDYYNIFLKIKEEDNTFSELVLKIEGIGKLYNISNDQVLELAVSFVQAIPYDTEGAEGEISLARYPYEVLYEKKGLCSGKSFLGALLVKELGYGVALFSFDKANHMVIGIKCPKSYSSYNSGYCYTELTTPGWKIGIENFDDIDNITSTERTPSVEEEPQIYEISDGKIYEGIYSTIEKKEEMKTLKKEIDKLNYRIEIIKEDLEYYKKIKDYRSYNKLVSTYNNLITEQREKIESYNQLIEEFSPQQ